MKLGTIAALIVTTSLPVAAGENNPTKFAIYAKEPKYVLALQDRYGSEIKYSSPRAKVAFFDAIIHCGTYGYRGRDVPLHSLLLALANTISETSEHNARVEYSIDESDGATQVMGRSTFNDLPGFLSRLRAAGVSPAGLTKISDSTSPRLLFVVSSKGFVKDVGAPSDSPGTPKTACEGSFGPIYSEF